MNYGIAYTARFPANIKRPKTYSVKRLRHSWLVYEMISGQFISIFDKRTNALTIAKVLNERENAL